MRAVSVQVVVLYVEQEESVRRQMHRAMATNIHNLCAPLDPSSLGLRPSWQTSKTNYCC